MQAKMQKFIGLVKFLLYSGIQVSQFSYTHTSVEKRLGPRINLQFNQVMSEWA